MVCARHACFVHRYHPMRVGVNPISHMAWPSSPGAGAAAATSNLGCKLGRMIGPSTNCAATVQTLNAALDAHRSGVALRKCAKLMPSQPQSATYPAVPDTDLSSPNARGGRPRHRSPPPGPAAHAERWKRAATTTVTATTVTTTTVTDTTTTSTCAKYDAPIVDQKGANVFRISASDDVPLEACLAACTAKSSNCAGVSHKVGEASPLLACVGVTHCCCSTLVRHQHPSWHGWKLAF
jgi:hypothetical protein